MTCYCFDPNLNLREIVLVGVGGTGSQLARSLARMVYDLRQRNLQFPALRFVDPDVVEAKNVGRQMFTPADVGGFKAELLARRFSAALGLPIVWYNEPFDAEKHLDDYPVASTLLIGAVDNHLARRALAACDDVLWLDCGNHFAAGQVVIGNRHCSAHAMRHVFKRAERGVIQALPNAAALFPALLEPDPDAPTPVSCADLVSMGEQHLLINDMIAGVAAGYVYKLLHRQPIHSFMTFVDLDSLNVRSVPIMPEALNAYLSQEDVA